MTSWLEPTDVYVVTIELLKSNVTTDQDRPSHPQRIYSGVMVCELKPSILATGFRFVLAWLGLGAPWMERGSFIKLGSSFAGVRPVAAPVSVGKRAEGGVAAAERHR